MERFDRAGYEVEHLANFAGNRQKKEQTNMATFRKSVISRTVRVYEVEANSKEEAEQLFENCSDSVLGHRYEVGQYEIEQYEIDPWHVIPATSELLEFAQHFFEWHAANFEDFDGETNKQLLCLANEAEAAIAKETK